MPGPVEFDLRVADTFLAKDAATGDTTLTLGHDSGVAAVNFPPGPFWAIVEPDDPSAREDVLVTSLTGAVATVGRAFQGSTARQHKVGSPVRYGGSRGGPDSRRVGCRVRRATAQSIPNATSTNMTFGVEDEDTDGFFAPSSDTITIPAGLDGLYAIVFSAAGPGAGGESFVSILPTSGIPNYPAQFPSQMSTLVADLGTAAITIRLLAGDSFVCRINHQTGAAVNFTGWCSCYRVGI